MRHLRKIYSGGSADSVNRFMIYNLVTKARKRGDLRATRRRPHATLVNASD
jgi:hypothetical protein